MAIYLSLDFVHRFEADDDADPAEDVGHVGNPYAIGVLVSSVSFLVIFRANYGYQRYWEACTNVHQLLSKWMDATTFAAVFHMQSDHYDDMRPPSFHDYQGLNALGMSRDRERIDWPLVSSVGDDPDAAAPSHHRRRDNDDDIGKRQIDIMGRSPGDGGSEYDEGIRHPQHSQVRQSNYDNRDADGFKTDLAPEVRNNTNNDSDIKCASTSANDETITLASSLRRRRYRKSINETKRTKKYRSEHGNDDELEKIDETRLLGPPRLDGGWGLLYPDDDDGADDASADHFHGHDANKRKQSPLDDERGFASRPGGGRTPSLFLQELTHLSSLLVAVALSTLRHDAEDAEPPLDVYVPGMIWPAADPRDLPSDVKRKAEGGASGGAMRNLRYMLGMDQTQRSRTTYNAARPMLVLGGVSDNEISCLRRTRGRSSYGAG